MAGVFYRSFTFLFIHTLISRNEPFFFFVIIHLRIDSFFIHLSFKLLFKVIVGRGWFCILIELLNIPFDSMENWVFHWIRSNCIDLSMKTLITCAPIRKLPIQAASVYFVSLLPHFTHRQQIEFITSIYCYNWIFDFLPTWKTNRIFLFFFEKKIYVNGKETKT